MKNKNLFKTISFVLIILGTIAFSIGAKPDNAPINMNKKQAVDTAIKNSTKILKLDTGLETLARKRDKANKVNDEIKDLIKVFNQYKSAYDKLNSKEFKQGYAQLTGVKKLYKKLHSIPDDEEHAAIRKALLSKIPPGLTEAVVNAKLEEMDKAIAKFKAASVKFKEIGLADDSGIPKELTLEEEYNTFIYPRDIPWYMVQCMTDKMKMQKQVVQSATDVLVKQGYDSILYAEEGYNITKQLYDKQVKDYNNLVKKYKVGLASQLEKNLAEMELKKAKIHLDNLAIQVENGKIKLKQSLGVEITKEYIFKDEKLPTKDALSFNEYLGNAMKNRAEVLAAKIDLDEKQRTLDIISKYFTNEDYKFKEAEKDLVEAKSNYEECKKEVEIDIQNSYLDVKQKQAQLKLASKKLEQSKTQYDAVNKSYKAGVMPLSMMWNVELGVNKAQMDYNTALRDYNNALYALEENCKIGTKYVMKGLES